MENLVTPDRAFWHGRRVLITGHTGFKGAWLCKLLSASGAQLSGFAQKPPTDPSLYQMADVSKCIDGVEGDVRDYAALRQAIKTRRPEIIFHLAAQSLVRRSYQAPVETYSTNVMGTVNLLEALRELSLACVVVNVTSDKCYENLESSHSYVEDDRLGGHDPYSSSKACAELVTASYRRSFFSGADSARPIVALASARAGNVIGGGDWAADRLVPDCVRAIMSGASIRIRNPDALRPWQHVLDPLSGYLLLAERLWNEPRALSRAWNFGPDESDTWPVGTLAVKLVEFWGGPVHVELATGPKPHEAQLLKLDCTLAKEVLDWRPTLDLATALEWTVEWYKRAAEGEPAAKVTTSQIQRFLKMRE